MKFLSLNKSARLDFRYLFRRKFKFRPVTGLKSLEQEWNCRLTSLLLDLGKANIPANKDRFKMWYWAKGFKKSSVCWMRKIPDPR